jgi:hypothetical protein
VARAECPQRRKDNVVRRLSRVIAATTVAKKAFVAMSGK